MSHTVLITGANRGIGLEFVQQYLRDGWHVFAASRNPDQAKELQALKKEYGNKLDLLSLDLNQLDAAANLRQQLQDQPIDVLINNAGIYRGNDQHVGTFHWKDWEESFRVNTFAPLQITEALLSNLQAGKKRVVINITSEMGSIAENSSGGSYAYRSSKSALNSATRSLALELKPKGIIVALIHPGWVKTDMGGEAAPLTPEQSVKGIRRVIEQLQERHIGAFLSHEGSLIPW